MSGAEMDADAVRYGRPGTGPEACARRVSAEATGRPWREAAANKPEWALQVFMVADALANADLNDGNCASWSVANRRLRAQGRNLWMAMQQAEIEHASLTAEVERLRWLLAPLVRALDTIAVHGPNVARAEREAARSALAGGAK